MFRLTEQHAHGRVVLKLEGRCSSDVVGELEAAWRAVSTRTVGPIWIDLSDVWLVDPAGCELLAAMHRAGAKFVARGCFMREVVREIAEST